MGYHVLHREYDFLVHRCGGETMEFGSTPQGSPAWDRGDKID